MSRIGKIARLPEQIREQINRRIQDGEEGKKIIDWLNSVVEVKTALSEGFDNCEITDGNLCLWKQGGFRDWEAQQAAMSETHRLMAEGGELAEASEGKLADKMAVWLLGRYAVVTRKLIENEDDPAAWKLLRELCHDFVALRRGDHGAEWLHLEQERLKLLRQKNARERKKAKLESKEDPPLPTMDEEEKERIFDEMWGPRLTPITETELTTDKTG